MFENVLVGVDGRPSGRDALDLAARLMDPDGHLTLAHMYTGELLPMRAVAPGQASEQRRASQELLERERAAADLEGELVSLPGTSPGRALHEQAEEQDADLLVVGSTSRGALGRAMLGDDTRAALNGAPCAVAIAAVGYAERSKPIAEVGVAYNDSPESRDALALAQEIAAPTKASVRALEVVSIPTYAYTGLLSPDLGDSMNAILEEASERMRKLPGVEGRAVYGLPGEELATFGDEVDILVVGSRGYGPLRRLVVGSTSDFLERHARCSLLVLPRGASRHAGSSTPKDAA